jgi:hypothetical protein
MFWSAKVKREKFVKRAEDLGGSIQLSFYEAAKKILELKYDDKTSVRLAAALANYVFHFGLVAPIHTDDKSLMAILLKEKSSCLSSLGDIFKTNATGVLILLGAAWQVDLENTRRTCVNWRATVLLRLESRNLMSGGNYQNPISFICIVSLANNSKTLMPQCDSCNCTAALAIKR